MLDGDPANLFAGFPVYDRGAMIVEGTRQIIGRAALPGADRDADDRLPLRQHQLARLHRRGQGASGFGGARLALLDQFLEQWIYGETKPTILPEDFS